MEQYRSAQRRRVAQSSTERRHEVVKNTTSLETTTAGMTTTSTYDTRRFPLCAPWDGEVGVSFIRNFRPTFKAALATRTDKFSNLLEHIEGNDVGGVKPTTAAQYATNYHHINDIKAHQGTGPYQRESLDAFNNRAVALVGHIRAHIEVHGIKADIDKVLNAYYAKDYATGCPVFPAFPAGPGTEPVYPTDHPFSSQPFTGDDLVKYQKHAGTQ